MALDLPISSPLTEIQGELTAKVGSMKSLLALPTINLRNIPKENQMSAFDYLLKILTVMGYNPEIIFNAYLTKVFDEAAVLEEKVFNAIAHSIGEQGIQLSPYINNSTATKDIKKSFKIANQGYVQGLAASTLNVNFLQTVKQKIAKDFMVMIFGPKQTTPTSLNPTQSEVDNLIHNAVCGEGMFTLSNEPIIRNEDVEFNRITLREQLEKGQVVYEISCQDVKIKLPEDPGFIFNGGGTFTSSSTVVTPAQSLNFMVQYVNNQVQRINNETNANKGGKKFFQILIEKLLSFISILVQPYLPTVFSMINADLTANSSPNVVQSDFIFSNCDIANDPQNSAKKEFAKSLFNALLKDLLKLLLLFVIKKFKQLVANYFAKTALEKQKRKLEKAKLKFQVFSQVADTADKIQKYQAAIAKLNSSILGNVIQVS